MYRISKLKLALIIVIFVFSALYLLPTIPGVYSKLYGFFDIWMQNKIPPPDVQSGKDGELIKFVIPNDLPKGTSVQEASDAIKDIIGRRLTSLGMSEEILPEETGEEQAAVVVEERKGSEFRFENVVTTELYVKFNQPKSQADLEGIVSKLELGGNPPLIHRPPDIDIDNPLGSIRFTITDDDLPETEGDQDGLENIKTKLEEQLATLDMKIGDDYDFVSDAGHELHVKFSPQKGASELRSIIENLYLYGGIPLTLRPIFPDNPLKQGLDLKGGLHIVLELDVEKAMDMYLDDQAKEVVLNSLKSEKIFCKSVEKTLEKSGNSLILRPYAPEDSENSQTQYLASMRSKLTGMGFSPDSIKQTSTEDPELTVTMGVDRNIGDLVDDLLGGNNPLIVTVTIPQRFQGADREDYIKTAEETLDRLELFNNPRLLKMKENIAVFSIRLSEESAKKLAEDNLDTVMETLENRINKFGVAESSIRRVRGRPRILVEVPAEQNPAKTLAAIKSPGILEFKLVKQNPSTGNPWFGSAGQTEPPPDEIPPGSEVRQQAEGGWYVLDSQAFLHGADLKSNSATVRRDEYGMPEVIMFLTGEGQGKFSKFTGQHVGENTAILLDEVIQSAPRITEKISSSSARMTGNFTDEDADYRAKILRAGAFPAPMKSAEERIVGPTLGAEAINRGKIAFIIGISLVIVFMMIYYKWSGAIAVAALLFNFQIILGVLAGFGATLTLPGMAGLILTIGMSVDANVLIFERIRDELRSGKTVRSSIDSGYQRAFWTILDANVTTLLTAIVLYEFGTGPIKGFAVTLAIGIMASMFTALVFTREIYSWAYHRRRTLDKLSI